MGAPGDYAARDDSEPLGGGPWGPGPDPQGGGPWGSGPDPLKFELEPFFPLRLVGLEPFSKPPGGGPWGPGPDPQGGVPGGLAQTP